MARHKKYNDTLSDAKQEDDMVRKVSEEQRLRYNAASRLARQRRRHEWLALLARAESDNTTRYVKAQREARARAEAAPHIKKGASSVGS